MRRVFNLLLLAGLAAQNVHGQLLKPFPWFNRGDPKIRTQVFVHSPAFDLDTRQIGIFPFSIPSQGYPKPPPFGQFLQQALLMQAAAAMVEEIPSLPGDDLPAWKARRLTEGEQILLAAENGAARALDFVIFGSVDTMFRKPPQGLVVQVTIRIISTETGEVVWYGTQKARWLRHFPLDECLLHLTWSFVSDWSPR